MHTPCELCCSQEHSADNCPIFMTGKHGVYMASGALKYDAGTEKLPWQLCPFEAVEGMLRVLLYGQRKYSVCGDCGAKIYSNPRLNGDPARSDCPSCGSTNILSGAHNWRKGFEWSRLIGAAFRHLTAFATGKNYDEESGELHLFHLMCCVAFLCEHFGNGLGKDDRFIY